MDWITTSGKTLDEAKSNALDQLGIVADEAEFDIINDVEKNLFGRVKVDAKVRTRVRPKQPAAKDERRRRNAKGRGNGSGGGQGRSRSRGGGGRGSKGGQGGQRGQGGQGRGSSDTGGRDAGGSRSQKSGKKQGGQQQSRQRQGGKGPSKPANADKNRERERAERSADRADDAENNSAQKKDSVDNQFSREDQERVAVEFLEGVLDVFSMDGAVGTAEEPAEDGAIEVAVTGTELGLLVGQKGATLNALQELTRTVVQREADGAKTERLRVDVAGYRERRTAALQDFAHKIAASVVETDTEKVLEPMGPADRKVVHDALTDVDGVETGSEGEEPRRRVVIRPV